MFSKESPRICRTELTEVMGWNKQTNPTGEAGKENLLLLVLGQKGGDGAIEKPVP